MKKQKRIWSIVLTITLVLSIIAPLSSIAESVTTNSVGKAGSDYSSLLNEAKQWVVVRNKPFGGTHYAYTEGLSDEMQQAGPEGNDGGDLSFRPGSEMLIMSLEEKGGKLETTERVILSSGTGVIRDPDVSEDGTMVVFSWKKNKTDDYHLYTMDLTVANPEATIKQLTFGSGTADFEPKFLANGKIVFSSSRVIENIDCWKVPVSNLYTCDLDGGNMIRLGYDQVHTTYPTVTSDGRVIYTRWDYNDRNQMYIQGLFQMQQDGTNQTELWGNGTGRTTTLLHPREIPGTNSKYVAIESGHHVWQAGKMVIIDTAKGRNDDEAVTYAFPDDEGIQSGHNIDNRNQDGPLYRYPYALNDHEFLVSYAPNGWDRNNKANTPFGIYYMNTETGEKTEICKAKNNAIAASQFVPIKQREIFNRPSMVNYAGNTGTVYVGNVYEGEGMEGFERTADKYVKYLRVVALEFRTSAVGANASSGTGTADPHTPVSTANGSWDVKRVLGIVDVEADGSAMFKVPSDTPVYFQLLDKDGNLIQTMRSWSTLMPGETFSCVGCHEDKNTVPPANSGVTLAMKKGVQELKQDLWMDMTDEEYKEYLGQNGEGFSYKEQVQPILDASCVSCHNDTAASETMINATIEDSSTDQNTILAKDSTFTYKAVTSKLSGTEASNWMKEDFTPDSSWKTGKGPFGGKDTPPGGQNTEWDSFNKTGYIYLRNTFEMTQEQIDNSSFILNIAYDESPEVYINGVKVFDKSQNNNTKYISSYKDFDLTSKVKGVLKAGKNTIAVYAENLADGGCYIGFNLKLKAKTTSVERPFSDVLAIRQSGWDWRTTDPKDNNWNEASYTPSASNGWSLNAKGGFGDGGSFDGQAPGTIWKTPEGQTGYIWMRKEFTITDDIYNKINSGNYKVYANVGYDESPTIYLNGQKLTTLDGYSTKYLKIDVTSAFKKAMKKGENLLAISGTQTSGGQYMDCGFVMQERAAADEPQFSLKGDNVVGDREKMYYTLSYLVLTASTKNGNQFKGNSTNSMTNWVSAMSQCEVLDPEQFGSSQSNMIKMLEDGHYNVKLSNKDLQTLKAWIDLGVPFRGDYEEAKKWGLNDKREYEEKGFKRAFYETQDEQAKARLANGGVAPVNMEFDISYVTKDGKELANVTGTGQLTLNINNKKLVTGDKVIVTLPEGVQYIYFTLSNRMSEALIYVPNGKFEYTVPSNMSQIFPKMVYSADHQTITARIPTEAEVKEVQNLSVNPYDTLNAKNTYPHASATNSHDENNAQFLIRNAIDGYTNNEAEHGDYPRQSWGPKQNVTSTYTIDFGRKVDVSSFNIVLRGDFNEKDPSNGHDGGFTKAYAVLSDGTKKEFKINTTHATQTYTAKEIFGKDTVQTTSLKLELTPDQNKWSALTEVQVFGSNTEYSLPTEGTPSITDINVTGGTLDQEFASNIHNYTVTAKNNETGVTFNNVVMNAFGTGYKVYVDGKETQMGANGLFVPKSEEDVTVKFVVENEKGETAEYTFKVVTISVKQLQQVIDAAQALVDNAVVGDKNGDYPQAAVDALKSAIADAKKVADSTQPTEQEISDAIAALNKAMDTFKGAVVTVSDAELEKLIASAQDKYDSTEVGNKDGQTTQAAKDALKAAIDKAQTVADKDYRSQKEIDDAYAALNEAIKAFDSSIVNIDLKGLKEAIDKANALNKSDYTTDSWNALQDALDQANKVYNDKDHTAADVDSARDALNKAIDALVKVTPPDTSEPITPPDDNNGGNNGNNGNNGNGNNGNGNNGNTNTDVPVTGHNPIFDIALLGAGSALGVLFLAKKRKKK